MKPLVFLVGFSTIERLEFRDVDDDDDYYYYYYHYYHYYYHYHHYYIIIIIVIIIGMNTTIIISFFDYHKPLQTSDPADSRTSYISWCKTDPPNASKLAR